jgi:hypothetical protein
MIEMRVCFVSCAVDLDGRLANDVKPPKIEPCEACATYNVPQGCWDKAYGRRSVTKEYEKSAVHLTFPYVEPQGEAWRMVPDGEGYVEHIRDDVVEAEQDEDKDRPPHADNFSREILRLSGKEASEADQHVARDGAEEDLPKVWLYLSRRPKGDDFVV